MSRDNIGAVALWTVSAVVVMLFSPGDWMLTNLLLLGLLWLK